MGNSLFNTKEFLKFEDLFQKAYQKLLLNYKDHKKCKNDIFSPSCDFIFYNDKKDEYEELYDLINSAEIGKGLNRDLSILFQKVITHNNDTLNLFNSIYSKLISLYPNSLTLISNNLTTSSVFLTSKFLNIIFEMKKENLFSYHPEKEMMKLEEDIQKMVQFLLDNIYSVTKIEELLHLSKFISIHSQNLFMLDWGTKNYTIFLNNSINGEKSFVISVKNGRCKKVPLEDTEVEFNETAFMKITLKDQITFKPAEDNFGEYYFNVNSDFYHIKSSKKIVSFTRVGFMKVTIDVKSLQNNMNDKNYEIIKEKQNTLNLSLVAGDIVTFHYELVNIIGKLEENECHISLLMHNMNSFKERVIPKRKTDTLLLDLSDSSNNEFSNGNYSTMLIEDCPFTVQKGVFFLGFISIYRENSKLVDKIYDEYFETKPLLEHTFQPPMVVANEYVCMFCVSIPFIFALIFKHYFGLNILSFIEMKETLAHLYNILFICSLYLISGLLIYYWTMLNLFEMLFYLAIILPACSIITLKFLQNLEFEWPQEKEIQALISNQKGGKEKDKQKDKAKDKDKSPKKKNKNT